MARPTVTDPLRNFKFRVQFHPAEGRLKTLVNDKFAYMGFSVVSGLTVQNEMVAYREGGMNTHPHKMIGQSDYGPVTFTNGVFSDQDGLYRWQQFMHTWLQGGNTADDNTTDLNVNGSVEGNNDYRCDISVIVYDHPISAGSYAQPGNQANGTQQPSPASAKFGYKLFNCWPASYSLGDLNAGDSSILIQQMVVNHEGFDIVWSGDVANGNALESKVAGLT